MTGGQLMAKPARRATLPTSSYARPGPALVTHRPLTSLSALLDLSYRATPAIRSPSLLDVEDRRTFYPSPARPIRQFRRWQAPITTSQPAMGLSFKSNNMLNRDVLRFKYPKDVLVCHRRKTRKEVLFALNRTGRGSGSKRVRNPQSNISCKG